MSDHSERDWWTSGDVAAWAGADPRTVLRWAREGRLPHTRTLGGHLRFDPRVVKEMIPDRKLLMTRAEVCALFRVGRLAAIRWATTGRLRSIRTLGGHVRFFRADVEALLRGEDPQAGDA